MGVPFVDLSRVHLPLRSEFLKCTEEVIDKNAYIGGSAIRDFEASFARFAGQAHCVGVSNGTAALVVTLRALGVGAGDEVIVPASGFAATAEAVELVGARVVFCDVNQSDLLIDVEAALAAVSTRTKAVIAVHLYGQQARTRELRAGLPKEILLIEDCAQAHGLQGVGQVGELACWSFYPGKNLGALGDAGAVTTDDKVLAERIRMMSNHGRKSKYDHEILGDNLRLDALQARYLSVKLPHLPDWVDARRAVARRYDAELPFSDRLGRVTAFDVLHAYHLYVVRTRERDALADHLRSREIGCGIHYPIALNKLTAFEGSTSPCPIAETAAEQVLSLPLFVGMTSAEQSEVIDAVRDFFAGAPLIASADAQS